MTSVPSRQPLRIPTSRAYWELKAEQVMNRVFAPEPSIDVEILETPAAVAASPKREPAGQGPRPRTRPRWPMNPTMAMSAALGVAGLALTAITLTGLGLWSQQQQALQQERNMLLVERLRSLASQDPAPAAESPAEAQDSAAAKANELPPPPPDEPWMEELATLPPSSAPPARVLQVPLSSRIGAGPPAAQPAPAAPRNSAPAGGSELPQLVGVIQIPGQGASAIFQLAGSSTSAAPGESIGNSGWRLRSANGDSAVIERGGEQQRLSISSGF